LTSISVAEGNSAYDSRNNCNAIIRKSDNRLMQGCRNTVIPADVRFIAPEAFVNCKGLTSISIPSSVEEIRFAAFEDCNGLTSVKLNEGLQVIFNWAFVACTSLSEITIPQSVTFIGTNAFAYGTRRLNGEPVGCTNLRKVTVLWDEPLEIEENVFMDYNYEQGVLYVPVGTKEKYKAATGWKNFHTILEIGEQPEEPEQPVYKDGEIFYATNADGMQMKFRVLSAQNKTCRVGGFDGKNYSFDEDLNAIPRSTMGSVTIPSEVNGLKVIDIGVSAFYECVGITAIIIPETVKEIRPAAFSGCIALSSIYIPSSVEIISDAPAISCRSLRSITVDERNPVFDSRENCNAIIRTDDNKLIQGCQATVIPPTVTSLAMNSFSGHSGLKEMTIPASITSIGPRAFQNCWYLETVTSFVEEPFEVSNDAFGVGWKDGAYIFPQTLYVPKGTRNKYLNTNYWNLFSEIIEMNESPKGDVNGDQTVDVADIASIISFMSGSETVDKALADVNQDTVVDVADIATIISIMAAKAREQKDMKE